MCNLLAYKNETKNKKKLKGGKNIAKVTETIRNESGK